MGPVICAVDDSHEARAAVAVAGLLAERLGLRLVLVHVEPGTEAPGVSAAPAGQERLREEELADARTFLQRFAETSGAGRDVELRPDVGAPADRIVALCDDEDAAFVVLGSRGRGQVRAAMLGSVSHAVASRARCPVVIVPRNAADRTTP